MQSTIEPIGIVEEARAQDVVNGLLNEPKAAAGERRGQERHPFFRPVTITIREKDGNVRSYSAFALDISTTGVGLLHSMELEVGKVIVTIEDDSDDPVRLQVEIKWSQPCSEGWYLSGSRFLGLER